MISAWSKCVYLNIRGWFTSSFFVALNEKKERRNYSYKVNKDFSPSHKRPCFFRVPLFEKEKRMHSDLNRDFPNGGFNQLNYTFSLIKDHAFFAWLERVIHIINNCYIFIYFFLSCKLRILSSIVFISITHMVYINIII